MRKFGLKTIVILLAAAALFVWLCADANALADTSTLGMDDSSGWIAMNSHNPEVMDTLEAAQVSMLQVAMPWEEVELSPGAYSWIVDRDGGHTDFNKLFKRLVKRGIQPVVVLNSGPAYLNHLYPQQPVQRDQLLENWEKYVHAVVEQFGSSVSLWQIGGVINDPEQWGRLLFPGADAPSAPPDPELYGEMLKIAYNVIKSEQSSDIVLLGELAFTDDCAFHPLKYLKALNKQGLWNTFDGISLSMPEMDAAPEYAPVDSCEVIPKQVSGIPAVDSLNAVAQFAERTGEKLLWVHGLRFSKDLLQAEAAVRATLPEVTASDYLARMSGLYMAYSKADRIFWSLDPLSNTPGLIALQTYANLTQILGGQYEGDSLPTSLDSFVLRFRGSGKISLLAWYAQGGEEALPMVIGGVDGYDLNAFSADSESFKTNDGLELPVDAGGSTALLISERPVLISGHPSDIKQTLTQSVKDRTAQAGAGLKAKTQRWLEMQKVKIALQVDNWVADKQANLLGSLRSNFEKWLWKSLGLAKL